MNNPLHKKRESYKTKLRKDQIQTLFQQIRLNVLHVRAQELDRPSMLDTLVLAYEQLQKEQSNLLNVFMNIQPLIKEVLADRHQELFWRRLSLWLYIRFTADVEIMVFLAQNQAQKEWRMLLLYMEEYPCFKEEFYERMKVLLELLSYAGQNSSSAIFDITTTAYLIELEPQSEEDSMYFQFLASYISSMPKDHLYPLLTSGFALRSLEFTNKNIFFSIVGRLQAEGESDGDCSDLCLQLLQRKMQMQDRMAGWGSE